MEHNLDHDLLITLNTKVDLVLERLNKSEDRVMGWETRLRAAEDTLIKISPVPAYSHLQLLSDVKALEQRIGCLEEVKHGVSWGWRTMTIIGGAIVSVVNVILFILFRTPFHF